ncbi:MAG: hypothetical protein IMF01_09600 [Proteobacteria bacterium]|nr:hypothetical protein [Pseudomonadota bacterium]
MRIILLSLMILLSCSTVITEPIVIKPIIEPVARKEVNLCSTIYYTPTLHYSASGIPVRDKSGKVLSRLSSKDFCALAMEGSGYIKRDGKAELFNWDGTGEGKDTACNHSPSSYGRFYIDSTHPYGVGNRDNPLIPFYSVACDQKIYKYGQRLFIPGAKGVILPSGKVHDGYFRCDDVGGKIKSNHIDTFIGLSNDWANDNPFKYAKGCKYPKHNFKAYLVN